MTVYNRLLNLYGSGNSLRTPKEDFCTECLAGILESDQSLLNDFVTSVLKIRVDENFRVETQKVYFHEGTKSIVDMVFQSRSVICFMEMKVDSSEGANQLQKYHELLMQSPEIGENERVLMYCTLYLEEKDHEWPEFRQVRWKDIAEFFAGKTKKNTLIKTFYQFLEENKMAGNERFSYEDLIGLGVYGSIASKVYEVFLSLQNELEEKFTSRAWRDRFNQVTDYDRLAFWCEHVLGDGGSEVLFSFEFSGSAINNGPRIVTQLWVESKNSEYSKFVSVCTEREMPIEDIGNGTRIIYKEPLANFIEKENQLKEIENWFSDHLKILFDFKKSTDLDWK